MVCKDAQTAMHNVLDQPDGVLNEELTQHLQTCSSCNQNMQMLAITIHSLHELEWLEAPDSISAYVMQQIRQDSNHHTLFWQLVKYYFSKMRNMIEGWF